MNTPALNIRVSEHGKVRFAERVNFQDQAEMSYLYLYLFGRDPTDEEMLAIGCKRLDGREYRLCAHGCHEYLIVYDALSQTFVTLWKR